MTPSSTGAVIDVADLIGDAILAPSSHNTQPWLFGLGENTVALYAETRALPVNDPHDRELTISCGAALFNLKLAARSRGAQVAVDLLPERDDPDLLARLRVTGRRDATAADRRLYQAIPRRRTYRKPFADGEVPEQQRLGLGDVAWAEGAWLHVVSDKQREGLVELVAEGDRRQFADPRWRRELAAWMHPRRTGDGLAVPELAAPIARAVVGALDLGKGIAGRDERLARSAPVIAVLGTETDGAPDWLAAGQALERVLLEATADGLQASYLNQPNQLPDLRSNLQHLIGRPGFPQICLRLGHPTDELAPAPRRPVAAVIEGSP